jgi:hypothetical protein
VLIISGFLDEEPVLDHGLYIVGRLPKPQSLHAVVQAVRAALARRPPAYILLPRLTTRSVASRVARAPSWLRAAKGSDARRMP